MDTSKDILISEGRREWWQTLFAAIFYAAMIYYLFYTIIDFCSLDFGVALGGVASLYMAATCFVLGIRFSLIQNIHFDLENKRYKKEYTVGMIGVGFWKPLPEIEYVSVFKQHLRDNDDGDYHGFCYNLNMWYPVNKHFTIYTSDEPEPVFHVAKFIAKKLNVDLLDATVPNDSKWLEPEESESKLNSGEVIPEPITS